MVRIVGVQGSPRKGRNTEVLLRHALAAAEEAGAETELVNLAELDVKSCDPNHLESPRVALSPGY